MVDSNEAPGPVATARLAAVERPKGRQAVQHEILTYEADGLTMKSQLFFEPSKTPKAGVLVFPEAFGLGSHAISRAERLAKMGYAGLACDLHGEGRVIEELQEALDLLAPPYPNPSRIRDS